MISVNKKESLMYNYGKSFIRHKKCIICGKQFDTQSPTTKTCSPSCSSINKQRYEKKLNKWNQMYKKI